MTAMLTHQNEDIFPEPYTFRPERWLETGEGSEAASRPRFAYFPFGAGTRVCIGEHFAIMEAVLVIATIAQSFRLELAPSQTITMWPQLTLRPRHPIRFQLHPR